MGRTVLRGARLLDPEARAPAEGDLLLRDGRIEARLAPGAAAPGDAREVGLGGLEVAPGFLDLHFHGSLIFAGAGGLAAALRRDAASLLRHGTTAYLPTSVAWGPDELRAKVGALAPLLAEHVSGAAQPLGIHLEGPWINPAAAGAQPGPGIHPYEPGPGADALDQGEGAVRLVTLAPELPGAPALLDELARRGIAASLGHSLADPEVVDDAVRRGARHVTHLFNAMGGLHQRSSGLAATALADDRLSCDLICDGVHVHPSWMRVAARAKGERLVLITDRVDPPAGPGASFGSGALVDDGECLRTPDGRLAGSRVTLDRALANARRLAGMTQLEAVAACTLRPARVLGEEATRGTLRPGARADLAVLDASGRVRQTWLAGGLVFDAAQDAS